MRLSDIQTAYTAAIYHSQIEKLQLVISESESFSAADRIGIYQNNTIGALIETIHTVYAICESLVGKKYFRQLAKYHVQHNPSQSHNLDHYGDNFADTLKNLLEQRPELQDHAYLVDIARLEWALHQSYFAKDRSMFPIESFAALDEEQQMRVTFQLADDIHLLESPYPIFDIWDSYTNNEELTIHENEHNYLMIQRPQWQVTVERIPPELFQLLSAITQQKSLIDLTEPLAHSPQDLGQLIQSQVITHFGIAE